MSDKNYQNARTYEPGKNKMMLSGLQLFGDDENVAISRFAELNDDYPSDGNYPAGMEFVEIPNALTVIAGQLIRLVTTMEAIEDILDRIDRREEKKEYDKL